MIINDLYILGTILSPFKTNSILVIDTNAVLAQAIRPQCFEPISRRHLKIIKCGSCVDLIEFAECYLPKAAGQ